MRLMKNVNRTFPNTAVILSSPIQTGRYYTLRGLSSLTFKPLFYCTSYKNNLFNRKKLSFSLT